MNLFSRKTLLAVVAFATGCGGNDAGSGHTGGGNDAGSSSHAKIVFVTSGKYSGNLAAAGGAATGIQGADNLCQLASDAAGLGRTFKAWISDDTTGALSRIEDVGPWFLTGGNGDIKAFNNKANLATAPLAAIVYDENGNRIPSEPGDLLDDVWTGTASGGSPSGTNCKNWMSAEYRAADGTYHNGSTGNSGVASEWTEISSSFSCSNTFHLYCIEQ